MLNIFLKVGIVFIIFISIFNCFVVADDIEEYEELDFVYEEIQEAVSKSFSNPNIISRNVVVFDRDSNTVIWGKNENQRVPMASTTKIMTAIIFLENTPLEKLETEIEVCKPAANIGGSRLGLSTGDKIKLKDLLYGLMLCSRK